MKVSFLHHVAPCNNRLLSYVLGLIGSQAFAWMNSPGKAKYCLIKEGGMKPLKHQTVNVWSKPSLGLTSLRDHTMLVNPIRLVTAALVHNSE